MKKLFWVLSLCCLVGPVFADNTNYNNVDECREAMIKYDDLALKQNQAQLSAWFTSFALNIEAAYDSNSRTVTFYEGCHFLNSDANGQKLWLKIQTKLNNQIAQLQSNQASLYGSRAKLVCAWNPALSKIDFDSCQ